MGNANNGSGGAAAARQEKRVKGFTTNIEKQTRENTNFRKVLYTAEHMQLVVMNLAPEEEIGEEVHRENDQFFRVEQGYGKCIIDGNEYEIKEGDVIIIPAGARHNLINLDTTAELKVYTIYSPPHHKDGLTHATKQDAENDPEDFDGVTTE